MIVGCNNNIDKIIYSGYTITKVYACGGELVYSAQTSGSCDDYKVSYSRGGIVTNVSYNDSYKITRSDTTKSPNYGYITNVVIGKCVEEIGTCSFCDGLVSGETITIPSAVTRIDTEAFTNNTNLKLVFEGTIPPYLEASAITCSNCSSAQLPKMIVPCKALNRYKTAWPAFSSRISATTTSCTQLPVYDYVCDYVEKVSGDAYVKLTSSNFGDAYTKVEVGMYLPSIIANTGETHINSGYTILNGSGLPQYNKEWGFGAVTPQNATNWFQAFVLVNSGNSMVYDSYDRKDKFKNQWVTATITSTMNSGGTITVSGNGATYSHSSSKIEVYNFSLFEKNITGKISYVKVYATGSGSDVLIHNFIPVSCGRKGALYDTIDNNMVFPTDGELVPGNPQ